MPSSFIKLDTDVHMSLGCYIKMPSAMTNGGASKCLINALEKLCCARKPWVLKGCMLEAKIATSTIY